MGIFEKSIPKYVVNPINQGVEVQPEEVYIDDIFDPLFNAKARDYLSAKHGDGLYGVVGGYGELLNNVWNGEGGLFGKGMGVLSTFGRSMEKADDIVLGGLTEGVKGITGQGFENPISNIFVNDQDYTGRRLLAAMANSMRHFAGGTTVDESDFGPVWGPASLGIELTTDVGILGGSVARKLAPEASKMTSKQLLKDITKADAKTAVGEAAQLMSNYDDFMARVAIDITAPGLRPAFKKLGSKFMDLVKNYSPEGYVEIVKDMKTVEDDTAPIEDRLAAQKRLNNNPNVAQAKAMFEEPFDKLEKVPEESYDFEVFENGAEDGTIERMLDSMRRDLLAEDFTKKHYSENVDKLRLRIKKSQTSRNAKLWRAFEKVQKRAAKVGWKHSEVKVEDVSNSLDELRKIVADAVGGSWGFFKNPRVQYTPDELAYFDILSKARKTKDFKTIDELSTLYPEITKSLSVKSSINPIEVKRVLESENFKNSVKGINREYADEVMSKLESDDALLEALHSGEWATNTAANQAVNRAVYGLPYFSNLKTPYRVSPSVKSAVAATGADGTSYAFTKLRKLITQDVKSNKRLFNNAEELESFFNRPKILKKLEEFIPPKTLSAEDKIGLKPSDIAKREAAYTRNTRVKFINLLKDVYFPASEVTDFDYYRSLTALEDFVARNVNPNNVDDTTKYLKTLTPEELKTAIERPDKILNRVDFLRKKRLLILDNGEIVNSLDPGVEYFLSGELPKQYKYPDPANRYQISNRKAAMRLRNSLMKEYMSALEEISKKASAAKPSKYDKFFTRLYDTVDDISVNYLQMVRDEMPHHLKIVDTPYSLDATLKNSDGDDAVTTFADTLEDISIGGVDAKTAYRSKNRWDDENALALSRSVSNWLRNTIPPDADVDTFTKVVRPLADFLDVGYKTGVDVPITANTQKAVDRFYRDVVPLVERLSSNPKFKNFNLGIVFSDGSKGDPLKKIKNTSVVEDVKHLRNLLGAPLATSPDEYSEYLKELYNKTVTKYPVSEFGFKPAHGGRKAKEIADFLSRPKSPTELITELDTRFNDAAVEAALNHQDSSNLYEHFVHFNKKLNDILDDLGTNVSDLDEIFSKIRTQGYAKLTPQELSTYRAYVHLYPTLLKETPYRVYSRNAFDFRADTNWSGIRNRLPEVYPVVNHKLSPQYTRMEKLLNREYSKYKQILKDPSKTFYYKDDDLNFVKDTLIPRLPSNVKPYWSPSHKDGLFHFDLPEVDRTYLMRIGDDVDVRPERYQIESFMRNVDPVTRADVNDISIIDYGTLYSKSGKAMLTDVAARLPMRMNLIKDKPANLVDVYTKAFKEYNVRKPKTKPRNIVKQAILEMPVENVAKDAYDVTSPAQAAAEEVANTIAGRFKNSGNGETASSFLGEKRWSLWEQIQKATAVVRKNAKREGRATLRTQIAQELGKAFESVTSKARPEDFRRFYKLRSKMFGDTVKGSEFWTTFRRSGMLAVPYEKGSAMIGATQAALTKNANLINEQVGKDIVEVVTYNLDNGNVAVVMRWNGNKQTAKLVKDAQKKLDTVKFDDVVFTKASALTTEEQAFLSHPVMRELSDLMDRLQAQAADQAKYMGFQFDSTTPYTKHAMRYDPETAFWMNNNFYTRMSSEDYDTVSKLISDFDGYRQQDRGVFGSFLQERRFRGDYWLLDAKNHPLFEYSPDKVFNSTLGDGIFANLQYQTFTDLFVNDNFKIKGWFNSVDDLKEVLYAKTPNGKVSGNLHNLELVSFKTDANGKIIGLTKFDKMSDAGLAKALADENTILVPANVVAHMDNLLRKDIRMNDKFWSFINKHFTIPFKFGLLSNPGFLLGNISDATLKLATTMSQKYGTTMAEEAANVAASINTVIRLKNTYFDVFAEWLKTVDEYGIKVSPEARIPEVVAMSPKYKDSLLQFLNGEFTVKQKNPISGKWEDVPVLHSLTKEQIDEARVYMMLQDMQMNSSKLREYADLAESNHTSDFEVPYNIFDRITQGKGKFKWKDLSTWGLFMNNPIMKLLTDASGSWEDLIRTASIVDDLKHKRYTIEQMSEYSKYVDPAPVESRRLFDVHLSEAKNTMFNAQFDYERVNDFLSGVGKVVPFPIFFLKNFGYWMELFMNNPQWVDNAIDVQEGLWQGYNEENDKFMTEAKGRGAIPVGGGMLPDWFKGVYKPSPLQSMFGAFNLLNDPIDNLTYRVNPLISGAATAVGSVLPTNDLTTSINNPDNVKYRPYSTNMYERNIKANDPKFNPIEYTLHRMNPFERAINTYLRFPEKVEKGEAQLSDVLPSVFQPMF